MPGFRSAFRFCLTGFILALMGIGVADSPVRDFSVNGVKPGITVAQARKALPVCIYANDTGYTLTDRTGKIEVGIAVADRATFTITDVAAIQNASLYLNGTPILKQGDPAQSVRRKLGKPQRLNGSFYVYEGKGQVINILCEGGKIVGFDIERAR